MRGARRTLLRAGLAAAAWPLLPRQGHAQDRTLGATKAAQPKRGEGGAVMKAPRRALVIGNSSYAVAPLKNPANDARAVHAQLERADFEVDLLLDATRAQMLEAIRRHVELLASRQAVGLFYFAGHGIQLAWRNYLVPTDSKVERLEDVSNRCVDLFFLIDGIAKAGNPMNIIVLDACRDNPLGADVRPEQKGLSQFDAPVGTLLAYATAPGSVASDGEGSNGLYTEHFVRELAVPNAKIEEVFKRVRLGVRRHSKGLQIPWESTSLEDDFSFVSPDRRIARAGDDYDAQQRAWTTIRDGGDAAAVTDFLRRWPTGYFAEIAQVELDRLLALQGEKPVQVQSHAANPYSAGTAKPSAFVTGDSYLYRVIDLYSKADLRAFELRFSHADGSELRFNGGEILMDALGNWLRFERFDYSPNQILPAEYVMGRKWATRFSRTRGSYREVWNLECRISRREAIRVVAGEFNAFLIEVAGSIHGGSAAMLMNGRYWMAPQSVRTPIAYEITSRGGSGLVRADRTELVSFDQA